MDLLEVKLDCDQTTLYQNLKDKSGKIDCPACKDHTIEVEQCMSMLFNKELILRKKIELALENNLKDELMIKLDDQFDKVVNQIDLQCENLIKRIKDYTQGLIDQLQNEKCELSKTIENMDSHEIIKESFVKEIVKEATLSNKIKIEKQYEKKLDEQKQTILDKMKECDYCLKVSEVKMEELVGSLELNKNFDMSKIEIENVDKARSEEKKVDHVNDVLNRNGSTLISLYAKINEKFVTSEFFGMAPLKSNRSWVADWELFFLLKNDDNTVTLQSKFNKRFVRPYGEVLVAKSVVLGDWEKFYLVNNQDDSYSFRSMLTKNYIMSDVGQSGNLVVRGGEINDHHKFYIEVRN
ncbi:cellulase (Glycosyl hydrolase family 5) [Brachionus plicatilis]|uniref:Cellulase (Glycosyl hydrolase family 5) n=1 Tax=Brachionus plicatilis TaxID=10195 RepID=A0A3M7Q0V1_BRAPC|nr:cellulase (Glycosyl hydrolase family 5) [Brachionus plicatilis]